MVLVREPFRSMTLFLILCVLSVGMAVGQETDTLSSAISQDLRVERMNFWTEARSYPQSEISSQAIEQAYAEMSRGQLVSRRSYEWESMGPVNISGRMLCVAVNPQNPLSIWSGSAGGGLWKSSSAGAGISAWESVRTGFPVKAVTAIAIHPQDTMIMYLGTGEVYNYQAAGTGNVVWKTRGTYGVGILKSTDGGVTWTKALDWQYGALRGVNEILFDPMDPNKIYAATTEGVYLSPNQGDNWFKMLNKKMVTDLIIHPQKPGWMIAAAGNLNHPDEGIYLSTDGGGVWTQLSPGVEYQGKVRLAIHPAHPDTVFASVGYVENAPTELLYSDDFGATWNLAGDEKFTYGWFAHDLQVSTSGEVICAGADVWTFDLASDHFTKRSDWTTGFVGTIQPGTPDGPPTFVHQNIHQISADPSQPQRYYFATDGGIYCTDDGGQTFINRNGGLQTAQFYPGVSSDPVDSTFFLGGMQNNGLGIYEGTEVWRKALQGEGGYTAIDPRSGINIFAGSSWMKTYQSANRGLSFTGLSIPAQTGISSNFIAPFVMAPGDPDRMYFGGRSFYRSDDMGAQVVEVSNGDLDSGRKVISIAVSHQNSDKVYVSTSPLTQGPGGTILVQPRAKIKVSMDGGATWDDINQALPDRMAMDLAVNPSNDMELYAVLGGFGTSHIYRTIDGGQTWTDRGIGLPDVPFTSVLIDPANPQHLYAGSDLGAWFSDNSGLSWESLTLEAGDPVEVTDLSMSASNRKLRMATNGRGMMEMPMIHLEGATSVSEGILAGTWKIFPNPSSGSEVWLEANVEKGQMVMIEIRDLQGRGIGLPQQRNLWSGSNRINLNTEKLSTGMYTVTISSDTGRKVLRWVRQ